MRVHVPQPFSINMAGPHGPYELACSPLNDDPWEGSIATVISGVSILWSIEETVVEEDGLCLIGLTNDPVDVWRDTYLFLLWPEANPPRIEYYGGQGLWRCDLAEGAPIVRQLPLAGATLARFGTYIRA